MVLDSQLPRLGTGRTYMASRRRRPQWGWIAVIVLVVGGALLYRVFTGSDTPTIATPTNSAQAAESAPGPTDPGSATPPLHAGSSGPRDDADRRPPTVPPAAPQQAGPVAPPAQPQPQPLAPLTTTSGGQREQLVQGMKLIEEGSLVQGRAALSKLLTGHPRLSAVDEQRIRDVLTSVNDVLVFSPQVNADDPLAKSYVVQSGDLLARIAPKYQVTYQFLEQINNTPARNLQAGKTIKIIQGPFFAVVSKTQFRMDLYLTSPDGLPVYVRSFPVGLGENDSTPLGAWIIKKGSKTANPDWRNPRTGEYYTADNPENPIGEYWLALEGIDENTTGKTGYGIHGTTEPESVGRMASMGCVRMLPDDIAAVFRLLVDGESKVYITR